MYFMFYRIVMIWTFPSSYLIFTQSPWTYQLVLCYHSDSLGFQLILLYKYYSLACIHSLLLDLLTPAMVLANLVIAWLSTILTHPWQLWRSCLQIGSHHAILTTLLALHTVHSPLFEVGYKPYTCIVDTPELRYSVFPPPLYPPLNLSVL